MATYNNPHWLLSHIRNSFISTDDTGLSETVMLLEDIPHQYAQLHKQALRERSAGGVQEVERGSGPGMRQRNFEDLYCYPGLDDSDDEDMDSLSQSYEMQMDQDIGFHRQRSNTAQKLERMDIARRKAAKVKTIKYETAVQRSDETDGALFVKKDVSRASTEERMSLLSQQLESFPKMPQNKFIEYAKFDGTSQTESKTFKIFLMMLPENQRAYPMQICVTATAKIQDFIGLICYKCSLAYPNVSLRSIKHYGLFMTEEDGEIDMDFPPLDMGEPCVKFCFSHLAIAERKASEIQAQPRFSSTIPGLGDIQPVPPSGGPPSNEFKDISEDKQKKDLFEMKNHYSKLEAPLYRAFQVFMVHKSRLKIEVQLGISGDKLEIDPIQQKSSKLWPRQKSANHSMDSVAHCSIVERKSTKSVVRMVYSAVPFSQTLSVSVSEFATSSPTIRQHHQQQPQPAPLFKHYDIETDHVTAKEIVEKINNILEVQSSPVRQEYKASRTGR